MSQETDSQAGLSRWLPLEREKLCADMLTFRRVGDYTELYRRTTDQMK